MINLDTVIFIVSAVVAIFGATMMISLRNPVLSVLSLIVSLVAQAVLYIQLGAMFLGAILIIVYAGAILVLFLFVIMLLNIRSTEDFGENSLPVNRFVKYALSLLLVLEFVFVIKSSFF
ncbi:MAG: NADH-quinone oxidoreductase subunit J, partial [Candidatus Zixiibacteriota bacterium]